VSSLAILIPIFNHDVRPLVAELRAQAADWPGGPVEIQLLDDGSTQGFRALHRPLAALPGVSYRELPANVGRAAVRNQLAANAQVEWLLLLDNDGRLPDERFLARYAQALSAAPKTDVFIGGTAYAAAPPADPALRLRWHYGRAREARPAAARQAAPYAQLTVNNALVRAETLRRLPFDEALRGYGHEDTRWGQALAAAGVAVRHLDNPVRHEGLEPAAVFLEKSEQAVRTLAGLLRREPALARASRLARLVTRLRGAGLGGGVVAVLGRLEPGLRRQLLTSPRPALPALDALKLLWLLREMVPNAGPHGRHGE